MILRFLHANKSLSKALTLVLLLGGSLSLFNLTRTNYPVVNWDILRIKTAYPNASSKNIEVKITNKIEKKLLEISGIEKMVSHSMDHLSLIMVTLDSKNLNPEKIKKDIRNKLDSITDLPVDLPSRPIIEEIKTSDATILELAITGKDKSTRNEIAKKLKNKLLGVEGILGVNTSDILEKEIIIEVNLKNLKRKKLSFQDLVYALQSHHLPSSGFQIKTSNGLKKILTHSRFENLKDLENLIVRSNFSGKRIRLKEVAVIKEVFEAPTVLTRTDSKDSHNLTIRASAETDNIALSKKIRTLVSKFRETIPHGIEIKIIQDLSIYTEELLSILGLNTILGFLLVLVILYFFLPPYVAFWAAMGIPLSFLGSFILFKAFGIPLNTVTLVSLVLVLGLLVDDAIVIAENIAAKKEQGLSSLKAATQGVKEIFWPVTVTIITTILAFLPLYFLKGISGQFIRHVPIVVTIALVISLLEATVLLPFHLIHGRGKTPKNLPYKKLSNFYQKSLSWTLKYKVPTLLFFVAILIGTSSFFIQKGKFLLFPLNDVDSFHVIAELGPGSTLEKTKEKMKQVEKIISSVHPDQRLHYTTRIGHHQTNVFDPFFANQENWATISVNLKPSNQRSVRSEKIVSLIKQKFKNLDGFEKLDIELSNDGPPVGKAFEISLIGHNEKDRKSLHKEIVQILHNIDTVQNITTSERKGKKQLSLFPDSKRLASMGVKAKTLEETIALAFQEQKIGHLLKDGEERSIKLKLHLKKNDEKNVLNSIPVPNAMGTLIPLKKLAIISEGPSRESFQHTRGVPSITIKADVNQSKMTSLELNKKIKKLLSPLLIKYRDVEVIWGGENKSTRETLNNLLIIFGVVLLLIYFSLICTLNSIFLPLIILGILPFGAVGILWAFYFHGYPLSFLSLVGGIGLLGIMVNDGLILISVLNVLPSKRLGNIIEVCQGRFRPVLLTTLTTVSGMIPTIYGIGGTKPFIVPIVLSVAGGIIFATFITLYMVPCLFALYIDLPVKIGNFWQIPINERAEAY
ncbi:MAG: efflux RND transporter permease subunit [Bdellovibrionota bacterium]|nr:efflux RND transporter permease subunit [Bdellovibrionota bacterium]